MSQQEIPTILVITPTRDQLNRFVIQYTDFYCHCSLFRDEEFARELKIMEEEYNNTGSITLTKPSMIENWLHLEQEGFIIDSEQ